ncbi:MAG: gliding motility-associated C-terminal domain-containing protein, partial [Cytophagales bacterium]|nr:gliding motility-associated C-terminal domain-containing protein [Cytophagales bacterium]
MTYTYRFTFPGPGRYVIYFQERNRNEGIVNMSNSVDTPFYVETVLTVNPTLGANSTPVLLNPPVDNAETGQRFCHNPAAFDPDGDSLAFRLVVPRRDVNTNVNGYRPPETVGPPPGTPEAGAGPPSF